MTTTSPAETHAEMFKVAVDLTDRIDAGWPTSAALIQTAARFGITTDQVRHAVATLAGLAE